MPVIGPLKRRDLIHYMRQLGFEGPRSGGRHEYMVREEHRVPLPNPHQGDISRGLLIRILREATIERSEWESL